MIDFARTARGVARLATEEEIAKEESYYFLATDTELFLLTDSGDNIVPNTGDFGYTSPNLHRRIDNDPVMPPVSVYPFVNYRESGYFYATDSEDLLVTDSEQILITNAFAKPFKQRVVLGVWDGVHSYRTTETFTHDEESTTCEIP